MMPPQAVCIGQNALTISTITIAITMQQPPSHPIHHSYSNSHSHASSSWLWLGRCMCPAHAHPHRADTKIYPWRPRPWLAARQLYEHVSFGSIADWLTGWLDGQLSFFPDSVPHPNHNNRAQISQYLSAKMLKQRLIILFHIFFFFCLPVLFGAFPRCWP